MTFVVTLRRRTLFYALNLLIPCVLLSSMTLLVFLLPANSGEKISLGEARMKDGVNETRCKSNKVENTTYNTAWMLARYRNSLKQKKNSYTTHTL